MNPQSSSELGSKRCVPCEGGVEAYDLQAAEKQLEHLPGWKLTHEGRRIRKDWTLQHFPAAMEFLNRCADLAEREAHHPDLHIEGYRNVWIEIWTHAIGGLSENDFILAAKIDPLAEA